MLAPLSWLKEYIDITLPQKELADRLTEVGLGVEKIIKEKDEILLELEITPNRPDCLSIMGVSREIAAIQWEKGLPAGRQVRYPKLKTDLKPKKTTKLLPLTIIPNFKITPRISGIVINNVTVKESPLWLKKRLESMGKRPINNIVDITNFVMFELGNPIHSFDYHKIAENKMWVKQAKGGEIFESVDEITYHLPKGAIIFQDSKKIFDLVGIKGGKNSGTYKDTKAVFIAVEVDDPILIRKASLALGLRSEASAIFERKVNAGGTIDALKRCVDLILQEAGGEIASKLYDLKEKEFKPWKLQLRLERLHKLLGIEIPQKKVLEILESLNLNPRLTKSLITCTIPTYRNDLQIEEDLIEEVARLYGYRNFPQTIPTGPLRIDKIPYFKDYFLDSKIKNFLKAAGFSEIYTYSLLSEEDLIEHRNNPDNVLRIDNPVSRDFEYVRPNLKINLLKALKQNKSQFKNINLFEVGKVYLGKNLDEATEEYRIAAISNNKSMLAMKGVIERLYNELNIDKEPDLSILETIPDGTYFELSLSMLLEKIISVKKFIPIPKYPPILEDISIITNSSAQIGEIIKEIKMQSKLIAEVSLLDTFEDTKTFHIVYQDPEKNLTSKDIEPIRNKILEGLKEKFGAKLK